MPNNNENGDADRPTDADHALMQSEITCCSKDLMMKGVTTLFGIFTLLAAFGASAFVYKLLMAVENAEETEDSNLHAIDSTSGLLSQDEIDEFRKARNAFLFLALSFGVTTTVFIYGTFMCRGAPSIRERRADAREANSEQNSWSSTFRRQITAVKEKVSSCYGGTREFLLPCFNARTNNEVEEVEIEVIDDDDPILELEGVDIGNNPPNEPAYNSDGSDTDSEYNSSTTDEGSDNNDNSILGTRFPKP